MENVKLDTQYGNIPSGIVEGFTGIVVYIETGQAKDKESHQKECQRIIEALKRYNETDYTSWEVTKCEMVKFKRLSQVTLVSFRVRDIY